MPQPPRVSDHTLGEAAGAEDGHCLDWASRSHPTRPKERPRTLKSEQWTRRAEDELADVQHYLSRVTPLWGSLEINAEDHQSYLQHCVLIALIIISSGLYFSSEPVNQVQCFVFVMSLKTDITLDASKFDPSAITSETTKFNEQLMKIMADGPRWWEVQQILPLLIF